MNLTSVVMKAIVFYLLTLFNVENNTYNSVVIVPVNQPKNKDAYLKPIKHP